MSVELEEILQSVQYELTYDILPFWMNRMRDPKGGFYGRINGKGMIDFRAGKGAVLNTRILWTFASAYRVLGAKEYLETARQASEYIKQHFIDKEYGGIYWCLDPDGNPSDTRKQFYALAFGIYGFSELYRASGDEDALIQAIKLYNDIDNHSLDRNRDGYFEAATREWGTIEDMRLSEKDQNDAKTMNTHLHILEAYTSLYRVWRDDLLAASLESLIRVFLDKIIQENGHLGLFFDEEWNLNSPVVSYGHDIEASWLLCEAADVLGNQDLISEVRAVSSSLASAAMEGFTDGGGMIHEHNPVTLHVNLSREWWVQAETVIGCLNQYQLTGSGIWKERALREWDFIKKYLICPDGEWYWSVIPEGDRLQPNLADDRAGFWKCPYHNTRMCLEILERAAK